MKCSSEWCDWQSHMPSRQCDQPRETNPPSISDLSKYWCNINAPIHTKLNCPLKFHVQRKCSIFDTTYWQPWNKGHAKVKSEICIDINLLVSVLNAKVTSPFQVSLSVSVKVGSFCATLKKPEFLRFSYQLWYSSLTSVPLTLSSDSGR